MHRWLRVLTVAALAGISAGAGPRSHVLRSERASLTGAAIREGGQRGRGGWGRQEPEYDGRLCGACCRKPDGSSSIGRIPFSTASSG